MIVPGLRQSRFGIAMRGALALLCRFGLAMLWAAAMGKPGVAQPPAPSQAAPTKTAPIVVQARPNTAAITVDDYRARLRTLDQLISTCEANPSVANCQSQPAGSDFQVSVASGSRAVRLGWLRGLLERAAERSKTKASEASPANANHSPEASSDPDDEDADATPNTSQETPLAQQFADAHTRIAQEQRLLDQLTNSGGKAQSSFAASQRKRLDAILQAKEYHPAAVQSSVWDRVLDKLGNWIDVFLSTLNQAGSKSKWFGYAAEIGFCALAISALIWFAIRLERLGRAGPLSLESGPGAASARDWQLWLEDARKAASQGLWRDAIHLLYWASVSRLESSGHWPADRARTPREYLALLTADSSYRPALAAITGSFERTWYGGGRAQREDFLRAEALAAKLGARHRDGVE